MFKKNIQYVYLKLWFVSISAVGLLAIKQSCRDKDKLKVIDLVILHYLLDCMIIIRAGSLCSQFRTYFTLKSYNCQGWTVYKFTMWETKFAMREKLFHELI